MRKLSTICAFLLVFLLGIWGSNVLAQNCRSCPQTLTLVNPPAVFEEGITHVSCFGGQDGMLVIDQSDVFADHGQDPRLLRFYLLDVVNGIWYTDQDLSGIEARFTNLRAGEYSLRIQLESSSGSTATPEWCSVCYDFVVLEPRPIINLYSSTPGLRVITPPSCHNASDARISFMWNRCSTSPYQFDPGPVGDDRIYFADGRLDANQVLQNGELRTVTDRTASQHFNNLSPGTYTLLYRAEIIEPVSVIGISRTRYCDKLFTYVVENPAPLTLSNIPQDKTCDVNGGLKIVEVKGGLATRPEVYTNCNETEIGSVTFFSGKHYEIYTKNPVHGNHIDPADPDYAQKRAAVGLVEGSTLNFQTNRKEIIQGGFVVGYESYTKASSFEDNTLLGGAMARLPILPRGSYWVRAYEIREGQVINSCQVTTNEIRIGDETNFDYTFTTTRPSCHFNNEGTLNNGEVTVNIVGGKAPYRLNWSDIGDTGLYDPASGQPYVRRGMRAVDAAGNRITYMLTITDASNNTCSVTKEIVIQQPEEIQVAMDVTKVLCDGTGTGSATATVTGGSRPYQNISWTAGQVVQTGVSNRFRVNSLLAGIYSFTVSDNKGCTEVTPVVVEQEVQSPIIFDAARATITPVTCFGDNDGFISITTSGGTVAYFLLLNPQGVGTQLPNVGTARDGQLSTGSLPAGKYRVVAFDSGLDNVNQACYAYFDFEIRTPDKVTVTQTNVIPVRCKGDATGSLRFRVNGGHVSSVFPMVGLPTGVFNSQEYSYELEEFATGAIITLPTNPAASPRISMPEGVNGEGTYYAISGLQAGTYILRISQKHRNFPTDAEKVCLADQFRFTVGEPVSGLVVRIKELQGILCNRYNNIDGNIQGFEGILEADINDFAFNGVPSGTAPYRYTWSLKPTDTPNTPNPNTKVYSGLPAGTYTVNVIDERNCTATASYTLVEPDFIKFDVAASSVTHPTSCNASDLGSINLVWNGQSGIRYSGGTTLSQNDYSVVFTPIPDKYDRSTQIINFAGGVINSAIIRSLTPGVYDVKVRDRNGCYDRQEFVVNPPFGAITGVRTDVIHPCHNNSNGTIEFEPIGLPASSVDYVASLRKQSNNRYVFENRTIDYRNKEGFVVNDLLPDVYFLTLYTRNSNPNLNNCEYNVSIDTRSYFLRDANGNRINMRYDSLMVSTETSGTSPVSCFNGTDGKLAVNIKGGYAPYYLSLNRVPPYETIADSAVNLSDKTRPGYPFVTVKNWMLGANSQSENITFRIHEHANSSEITLHFDNQTAGVKNLRIVDTRLKTRDGFPNSLIDLPTPGVCDLYYQDTVKQPQKFVFNEMMFPYLDKINASCNDQNDGVIFVQPGYDFGGVANDNITTRTLNDMQELTRSSFMLTRNGVPVELTDDNFSVVTNADAPESDITDPNQIVNGLVTRVEGTPNNWTAVTMNGTVRYRDRVYRTNTTGVNNFSITCSGTNFNRADIIVATNFNDAAGTATVEIVRGNPIADPAGATAYAARPVPPTPSENQVVLATVYVMGSMCSTSGAGRPVVVNHPVYNTFRFMNLADGNYMVSATNLKGCMISKSFMITKPAAISLVSLTNKISERCGEALGEVKIEIAGGTSPYRYRLYRLTMDSNGNPMRTMVQEVTTTQMIHAFAAKAGTYQVDVLPSNRQDLLGTCIFTSPTTVVANRPSPEFDFVTKVSDVKCNGGSTGIAVAKAKGGYDPNPSDPRDPSYTIEWYSTVVTTVNGVDTIIKTLSHTSRNGDTLSVLSEGLYIVHAVQDQTNCRAEATIMIGQPAELAVTISPKQIGCYNDNDGELEAIVTGGSPKANGTEYEYRWVRNQSQEISPYGTPGNSKISNLVSGDYRVFVRDANRCVTTERYLLANPEEIFTNISEIVPATCQNAPNDTDGSFKVKVNGGRGYYEVSLFLAGEVVNQIEAENDVDFIFRNLSKGQYTVQVRDYTPTAGGRAYGCTYRKEDVVVNTRSSLSVTVADARLFDNDPNNDPLGTPNVIRLSCLGRPTTAQARATGNIEPFTYTWTDGGIGTTVAGMPSQRNYTSAGNFSVIVEDGLGCTAQANFTVVNEPLDVDAKPKPVVCKGQNNGEISVTITGGAPDFTTTLLNSRNPFDIVAGTNALPSRNPRYINLAPGTYFVRTVDRENCEVIVQVESVKEADAAFEVMLENPTHPVSCNDAAKADGNARINLMGGKAPYRLTWVDRGTTPSTPKEATTSSSFFVVPDLTFGTTTVNIVDFYGCTRSVNVFIDRPAVNLEVQVAIVNNVDCINNIGSLSLSIDGGRPFPNGGPLYNVMWFQGNTLIASNTTVLNNLETGTYRYTVEDANGCVRDRTADVLGPELPRIVSAETTALICKDGENARIDISVAGGTAPYTYMWSNGAKTQDIANLKAGDYQGTITDAKGCSIVSPIISIINPDPLTIEPLSPVSVSACGASDGTFGIVSVVPSDRGPFSYTWKRIGDPTFNPGNVTSQIGTLAAGTYQITVRDNRGCSQTVTGLVGQPSTIAATATVSEISCATEAQGVTGNGSINLTVTGGVRPYMFMWSNGSTASGISNLTAGTYYGTVTDAEGCFILAEKTFVSPMAIAITGATVSNVKCNGGSTGAIMIDVAGGTAPLRFNWSNGRTTEDLMNIPAGTYQGTITDARGCVLVSGEVVVEDPAVLEVELEVMNAGCTDKNDGRIMTEVMGGTAPYTYMWSNGETTMDIADLEPGVYTVTVVDANACMMMMEGTVVLNDNLPAPVITVTNGENVFCVGGSVSISAEVGYLNYLWSVGDESNEGEATIAVNPDEAGSYDVFVTVTNACGSQQNSNIIEVVAKPFPNVPIVSKIGNDTLVATLEGNTTGVVLQWQRFNSEGQAVNIQGENSDTLITDVMGRYVVVANLDGCQSFSDEANITVRPGLFGKGTFTLTLYPNPTTSNVNLKADWKTSTVNVQILNTLGQVIQSFDNVAVDGSEVQIDLSTLANGVYNIRVQNADSIWTGSVIKN